MPANGSAAGPSELVRSMRDLTGVVQALSLARDLPAVQDIVRRAARRLTRADGATFVLRDGDRCFYADEDAIAPLWKGQRFPLEACISGWAMLNRRPVVIPDIYADDRIPHDAYRPTFVQSLAMMPIRTAEPLGAIGAYWATHHVPGSDELELLAALADSTAIAMEHVAVLADLEDRIARATADLRRLSLTDPLTGLLNRRGFLELAEDLRCRCARRQQPSQLLFVDLDGLKEANDRFGHEEGDGLICRAARILDRTVGPEAVAGRWGGDELVAFLPGTADPAGVVAGLQRAAAADNAAHPERARLAFSVGSSAVAAGDLRSLERLLAEADSAMYAAKRSGRVAARPR